MKVVSFGKYSFPDFLITVSFVLKRKKKEKKGSGENKKKKMKIPKGN